MDDASQQFLLAADQANRMLQQTPEHTDLYMARHSHPMATAYREIFHFFESMLFASKPGGRFYSFVDPNNRTEFGKPWLGVNYAPVSFNGYSFDGEAAHREELLAQAARAGWPAVLKPFLGRGVWWFRTTDRRMAHYIEGLSIRIESWRLGELYVARLYNPSEAEFAAAREIIEHYHHDAIWTTGATHPALGETTPVAPHQPLVLDAQDLERLTGQRDAWL